MPYSLTSYSPSYHSSWALIVGINRYWNMPPLNHAANDAAEVADTLINRFRFPSEQVVLLQDELATQDDVMSVFDMLASQRIVHQDDRMVVYFAGHGITRETRDGAMVGYLAPIEAEPHAWRTLIRMTDLISQARFLPAKHILFIIDACYSGLSLRRGTVFDAAVVRCLTHPAVQVITAGRAEEQVVDGGDLEGDNSIFTGCLLDALHGSAASASGMMTASDVMSYVYRHVTENPDADQTPQYGWLDGDGDFVFQLPYRGVLPASTEVSFTSQYHAERLAPQTLNISLATYQRSDRETVVPCIPNIANGFTKTHIRQVTGENSYTREVPYLPRPVAVEPSYFASESKKTVRNNYHRSNVPLLAIATATVAILLTLSTGVIFLTFKQSSRIAKVEHTSIPLTSTVSLNAAIPTQILPSSPPATSTLDALSRARVIFSDDFSADLSRWETMPEDGRVIREIHNNQMDFEVYSPYSLWITQPRDLAVDDGTIGVTASATSSSSTSSFGLIFRQLDLDNYYYYRLRGDGTYAVILQRHGAIDYLVAPSRFPGTAFDGLPHRHTVEMTGATVTLYFDNQRVTSVRNKLIASGSLGLAVETSDTAPAGVSFDDFEVIAP